jgi:poly(3-hydroxybutyrate) depolymerase
MPDRFGSREADAGRSRARRWSRPSTIRTFSDTGSIAKACVIRPYMGHSLGASFANSLACARTDRFRAVAAVAGGITPSDCLREVAALLLHNRRDPRRALK